MCVVMVVPPWTTVVVIDGVAGRPPPYHLGSVESGLDFWAFHV
jgi:hypothetical protein